MTRPSSVAPVVFAVVIILAGWAIGLAAAGPLGASSLTSGQALTSISCYDNSGMLAIPIGSSPQTHTIDLSSCPAPSGVKVSSVTVKVYFETDFFTGKGCPDCHEELNIVLSHSSQDDVLRVTNTGCCSEFPSSPDRVGPDAYTCIFNADSTAFNGLDVHGTWTIAANNGCFYRSDYTLKLWEIWVYWDLPTPSPTPTATRTPTPECWTFRGGVYDASTGAGFAIVGVQVQLRGAVTPYPFDPGTVLNAGTTGDTEYEVSTCETDGIWDYYRLELQVPPGWTAVNASSETGTVKSDTVIEFAGGIDERDLTDNNFWIRRQPTPTPTPTKTRTVPPPPSPTATQEPAATPTPTLPPDCERHLPNGDFEPGLASPWSVSGQAQVATSQSHSGSHSVLLGGVTTVTGELMASVDLPLNARSITLGYWRMVRGQDTDPEADRLVTIVKHNGQEDRLAWATSGSPKSEWKRKELDLTDYRGREITLLFRARNDSEKPTKFFVDDVELIVCYLGPQDLKLYLPLVLKGG